MTEPPQQALKDFIESFGRQRPEPVQRAHGGKRGDALDQKGPGLQKRRPNRDLEWRTAQAGRVWHDRDESAIEIAEDHADDQRGVGLAGLAEVNQPDLTGSCRDE